MTRKRCCPVDNGDPLHRHCVACGVVCEVGGHVEHGTRTCTGNAMPDDHGGVTTVRGPFGKGEAPWVGRPMKRR